MTKPATLNVPEEELTEKFVLSSGSGGQNVNKVATGVQLRFDTVNSPSISPYVKSRIRNIVPHLVNKDGILQIEATAHRSQFKNRQAARQRLADILVAAAEPPPKKRRPTRPTKGSVERRLKSKAGRAKTKKLRGKRISDD